MNRHRRSARRHSGFTRWRRTRPFWGGLFVACGGAAVAVAPLAPLPLLVHQGIAGVAGYTVGLLLVALGMLSWLQPAQRVFYGIAAVLLSLVSFVTSDFGGLGAGMLSGLVGGSLLAAWRPVEDGLRRPPARRGRSDT
ncbi:DUF6114 domain-containing protein [Streptomonospora litoralis]|uniref:Integral membrane protein n=1 Tax=Streptomonospora litoralis TaxID=2498135 RepID=A0A4P6QA79_9ACTN|nr:DUF6114 domain-containing protein [Streptomonospora litoralis]QBI56621.1 hypothetical protein EKD16_24385 [Streptomonospora litoralis]